MAGAAVGGIISSALELIKEKENQADKASARISDGIKTQMELTAHQGSWTGNQTSSPVVKEKEVVKETVKEPDKEDEPTAAATPPGASSDDDDDKGKNIADMGILNLAKGASK